MSTSQVPNLIDALLATVRAAVTLTEFVYDGPYVTDEDQADLVIIGDDGDPNTETPINIIQSWAGLGIQQRNEEIDVPCAVISRTGATDLTAVKTVRDRAFAVLAQIENVLRTSPKQGAGVLWAEVTAATYLPQQSTSGSTGWIKFTVHARNRI